MSLVITFAAVLSSMFYVIAHRPILLMLCLVGLGFLVGVVIHRRSGDRWGYGIIIPAFVLGMVNIFTGQWLNAAFPNAAGVHGTAVVVDSRRTDAIDRKSTRLNSRH